MVSEPAAGAVPTRAPAPPMEVVLPAAYYALLVAEAVGLVVLHHYRPEQSGGERWSYLLGWAGLGSMVVMHVYSIRRRVKALRNWGRLRTWLHFHIFMGLQGALLVTYHSLHLRDAASVQGINIFCVGIVVASGLFGRYLYAFIPKSIAGERMTASEIEAELQSLRGAGEAAPTPELLQAAAAYEKEMKPLVGKLGFWQLVSEDLRARRALGRLERAFRERLAQLLLAKRTERDDRARIEAFVAAARRRTMLTRRLATFHAADRLFRGWHLLHKPLTFLLAGATLLHVLGHYMFAAGMSG